MKNKIKTFLVLMGLASGFTGFGQTFINLCTGSSTVISAVNSLALSGPTYSMNPGGITSPNPTFAISPASATTYTIYVTGTNSNSQLQTSTNTFTVQLLTNPVTSVNPINQSINCGPGIVATATGTAINPNTNISQAWYGPGGAPPMITTGAATSNFNPAIVGANGTSTYVVTDLLTGCSTSKTVQVISTAGAYPSFAISSSSTQSTFTLGCGTRSITDVNIVNGNTTPPGGAIGYTILPPGYSGVNYNPGVNNNYTINIPGIYTVLVKDFNNLCETRLPLVVTQNTVLPDVYVSAVTRTLSCDVPNVAVQASSSFPNVNFVWTTNGMPGSVPNSVLLVNTTAAGASVASATVIDNYTLVANDNSVLGSGCLSTPTVITMYQNVRPPNALIMNPGLPGVCISTLNLTNNSTSGILPSTFFGNLGIIGLLWNGPTPQTPLSNSSTYLAAASGVYTMTAKDLNNGCTSTATTNVNLGPAAAFTHTVSGAQVSFSDASAGVGPNTSYFWDFGDGYASTQQNPVHYYVNGGAQLVKLKTTNQNCSDSLIQSVTVLGLPCNPNSGFSMVPTATAQIWNAIPNYPWNITAASWNWGDGATSNTLYTSHQYASAGLYNICLSVTVSCVGSSSTCTSYSVYRQSEENLVVGINVVNPALIMGIDKPQVSEEPAWSVQPNPNTGLFSLNIKGNSAENLHLVIADLSGRIVYDQVLDAKQTSLEVDAGSLAPGMYLLNIEGGGFKSMKRMVITR